MFKSAVLILKAASFFLIAAAVFLTACRRSAKTDLRKLAPSDALVYLETNEVAETLQSLTVSPAFKTLAADEPDFSALKNTQIAVVILGFETAEENLVLNLKPRFVIAAETHLWSWQTAALVETQLDKFVRKNYGAAAKLETIDRDGGRFFTWTAQDNRQTFAFTHDGLIYFGSDAAGIEKCLTVAKGETENLAKNESFVRRYSENNLAFGYVSAAGIKQIAQLAGVSIAVNATEEADGRNFVARVVPQILGNMTEEIIWTANRAERGGIEDKFSVKLKPETAAVVQEIADSDGVSPPIPISFLPPDVFSATFYNLKNPLLAWRGALLLTAKNTDALSGKILLGFAGKLLEPYAVSDAETFLSAIDASVLTVQFDAEGEKSVTLATVKDSEKLKGAISKQIDFKKSPQKKLGAEIWFSEDENTAAAFVENELILGDADSVTRCLQMRENGKTSVVNQPFRAFAESRSVAATFGRDPDSAAEIVGVLANPKNENRRLATFYTNETRLTADGFERVTVSDFGFVGTILKILH